MKSRVRFLIRSTRIWALLASALAWNGASPDSTATMPMRPIAKWRAREQDRGEFQSARIGEPGGFFGRLDRFCFDHGVLARMALARLALPRAGGGAGRLLRVGSLRQRGRHLADKSASAGRRGRARRFRFLCSGALLVLGLLRDSRGGPRAQPV